MDLLKQIQKLPSAPGFFNEAVMDKFGARATIPDTPFPKANFASKRISAANSKSLPQIIAHRGYKIKYPENTISAFEDAVEAGAHALETDLHLSKDGVVVLSHFSDDPTELVYAIRETFGQVDPGESVPWKAKVMLGYWTAEYIPLYHECFPGFPIVNIGFSLAYSRQFLAVPGTSFNMMQVSLVSPRGRGFIQEVQAHRQQILSWTVNDEKNIDWCIRREMDGLITDNVPKALEMCETYREERRYYWSMHMVLGLLKLNFWIYLFGFVFRRRYGTCINGRDEVDKSK